MPELSYEYVEPPTAAASRSGTHGPAAQTRRGPVVKFPPNIPVQVSLTNEKTKRFDKPPKPPFFMITTPKGVAFLEAEAVVKMDLLQLKPGELFWICRQRNGQAGDLGHWDVYLDPATERARSVAAPEPKASPTAMCSKPSARDALPCPPKHTMSASWPLRLAGTTNALIDCYAAALAYSERHAGKVRPDDVLALLLAAFNRGGSNGA